MPKKKKDKSQEVPITIPKPKGVLEIIVPVKNADVKPKINDYLKYNASYSEKNENSMDEETQLIKLQIEQRLNEMLQVPYEIKFPKTENDLNTAKVEDTKKLEKSTDACLSLISQAVSQIPCVVKKPEKEMILGVREKPKRDILVPLEKDKDRDQDYFKGTRIVKEKKMKPKKQAKVICFDSNEVAFNPTPHFAPVPEAQPVVVNRWQEKEGSKLFTQGIDEEEEMLQQAIRESLREAKIKEQQRKQEELLYQELTREAKKNKYEGRGNKIRRELHSWDSADGARGCDTLPSKIEEVKNMPIPNNDSSWDDEIDLVRQEIDERQAKKERVKKNLKEKLKLLDNYGPVPVEEKKKEKFVKQKEVKEEVKEKKKSMMKLGDEEVEVLEFVEVDGSDEEGKKKAPYDWSAPQQEVLVKEKNIQWNVTKKSDILLEKKMGDLTFNDIKENEDDEFCKNASLNLKTGAKSKIHQKDALKNSSVDSDVLSLPPRNRRPANERRKLDTKSQEVNENVFEEAGQKTAAKASLWNSTATSENRGFSKEYQNKRRENINKNTKSIPSKTELFAPQDIPKVNDDLSEKVVEGPFQDFEINVPKAELNNLNGGNESMEKIDKGMVEKVTAPMVAHYLEIVLQQESQKKQCNNQNLLNYLQVPNFQNNSQLDVSQLNNLQQSTGLDLSCLINNNQQASNLNLNNLGLQQASNINLPGMGNIQQGQIPNSLATGINFLNVLNTQQSNDVKLPDLANFQQYQVPNQQQIPGLNLSSIDSNKLQQQAAINLLNLINGGGLQQTNGVNLFDMANVQQNQNIQQSTGLNLPDMARILQSQVSNIQQTTNLNLTNMACVQQGQIPNMQQVAGLNLPDMTSIQQSQVPNIQQAAGLNLPDMTNVQQSQIPNIQQAASLNLPNLTNVQQNQIPNFQQPADLNVPNVASVPQSEVPLIQQSTGFKLPDMTSVPQSFMSNTSEAININMPNIATNSQPINDLSNPSKAQECQNPSELKTQQTKEEPTSDKNLEYETLMSKIKNLQEELEKEKEEKQLLEQQLVQNQYELAGEEQVEEDLLPEEQPVDQSMAPMMMPNPYLCQTVPSAGMYRNPMPMFYPVIPPASHLPQPPWPYMGPMVYRQSYQIQRPQ